MKGPTLKTRDEIATMDRANRIVVEILEMMRDMVKPGATTAQINAMAEEELAKRGARSPFKGYAPMGLPPYPAVVCASVNDVIVHGIPGDTVLQAGDIVGVDCGVLYNGYYGDAARTFAVGSVEDESQRLMEVTRQALELAVEQVKPGGHVSDIGWAVQRHVESHGFSVVRDFVGHGIGTALHEDPQVPNFGERGRGPRLRSGMVLAIEPMVNAGRPGVKFDEDGWTARTEDGRRSAHFEYSVAVTGDGARILGVAR
jgi:methionyl aminopeptidase